MTQTPFQLVASMSNLMCFNFTFIKHFLQHGIAWIYALVITSFFFDNECNYRWNSVWVRKIHWMQGSIPIHCNPYNPSPLFTPCMSTRAIIEISIVTQPICHFIMIIDEKRCHQQRKDMEIKHKTQIDKRKHMEIKVKRKKR